MSQKCTSNFAADAQEERKANNKVKQERKNDTSSKALA